MLLLPLVVAACATAQTEVDAPPAPAHADEPASAPAEPASIDYTPLVREIAATYTAWGAVDNQFHWAPGLCAMPAEAVQHLSDAPADTPHGEKVFVLHALDALAYWQATGVEGKLPQTLARAAGPLRTRADVEQVLVKESFAPKKMDGAAYGRERIPARRGEDRFVAGEPIGLFVMAKLASDAEQTDAGWIYATVSPSGDVTAAGTIDACRDCHAKEADRVFGVPLHWK